MESQPSFENVAQALGPLDLGFGPSYLHGLWTGLIMGEQYCKPQDWLDLAWEKSQVWDELPPQAQMLLLQMAEQTIVALEMFDFGFQLLLPDDDLPLQDRAQAIHEWCVGYVWGLQNQQYQQNLLTNDGAQALADITKISEMDFSTIECEEEEESYMEIVEFVRVAVLTVHQNLLEHGKSSYGSILLH